MQQHQFGQLPPVSSLTLGGGGLGMLWGPTTFDECVATVHAAVAAGITLLDLAPRYGDGKAEQVVGEAFSGKLPPGVRVTSKCNLGQSPVRRHRDDPAPVDRSESAAGCACRGWTCSSCTPMSCRMRPSWQDGATRPAV